MTPVLRIRSANQHFAHKWEAGCRGLPFVARKLGAWRAGLHCTAFLVSHSPKRVAKLGQVIGRDCVREGGRECSVSERKGETVVFQ